MALCTDSVRRGRCTHRTHITRRKQLERAAARTLKALEVYHELGSPKAQRLDTRRQRRGLHIEQLGRAAGAEDFAGAFSQRRSDALALLALPVFAREDRRGLVRRQFRRIRWGRVCRRQLEMQRAALREDDGAFHGVLEFADVAGPVVSGELFGMSFGETRQRTIHFPGGHADKVRGKWGDVFATLAQRWNFEGKHNEPIEQILPETAGGHFFFQIAVGGGNNAHVDLARACVADAFNFLLLQDPQQLGLHGQRDFPNLVEKERAAVGEFEPPGLVAHRARERAAHVPKEFAFENVLGDGATVDLDERPIFARAVVMDGPSDELFARPAFASDEHGGLGGSHELDLLHHFPQTGTLPNDVTKVVGAADFLQQIFIFFFQPGAKRFDFREGSSVGNAYGRVIRKNAQPSKILIPEDAGVEDGQHAQHFAMKGQRLRGNRVDAEALYPLWLGNPILIAAQAGQEQRFAGFSYVSDFPHAERKPSEGAIKPAVIELRIIRIAGARHEVQATSLVRAFATKAANRADVARLDKPDAREHDIPALGDATDYRSQNFRQQPVLSHSHHHLRQIRDVHGRRLR